MSLIFILIWFLGYTATASDFDRSIDYCFTTDVENLSPSVLDGPNFIIQKNTQFLNCAKRNYALKVLENPEASEKDLDKAIKTLGYQSTFSDRAALALMDFLERGLSTRKVKGDSNVNWGQIDYFDDGLSLDEKAAEAYYFLHDGFANYQVFVAFYNQSGIQNRMEKILTSEPNSIVLSLFIHVWQKLGNFFQLNYTNFSEIKMKQVNQLVITYSRLLIKCLNEHINSKTRDFDIRNEAVVALGNMSNIPAFGDASVLDALLKWYIRESDFYLRNRALTEIAPLQEKINQYLNLRN